MGDENGKERHDHVVASLLLKIAEDAISRAIDGTDVGEPAHVDWNYVSTQVSYAQAQLVAAGVIATMRAATKE